MRIETIHKQPELLRVDPNLPDLATARRSFSWTSERAALDGLPAGGLNIAHECVDRHAQGPHGDRTAIRWLGRSGERRELSYRDLEATTNRFANALSALDVGQGDRVVALTGRVPELYGVVLGALKHRAVACTLFSAFGPEPIRQRLALSGAKVLVTTEALYRRKVAPIREGLPDLRHVLLIDGTAGPGTTDLRDVLDAASSTYEIQHTDPEDMALLHFTSGTTGTPKGAIHVHDAVVAHRATARWALDLHEDDVFWCTADPGWVTGTSYGIIAPLALGLTSVVDECDFDPERWYGILHEEQVSVWYTAPTAIRMMMRAGTEMAREHALPDLRFIASVGEALNPEAVRWGIEAFGLPIHDNWWQTETGGIMIANLAAADIRPGSMGRPLPGIDVAILRRDENGHVVVRDGHAEEVVDAGTEGELALRPGWPSMFRGYLHEEERYRACFAGGWYLSGDLARRTRTATCGSSGGATT